MAGNPSPQAQDLIGRLMAERPQGATAQAMSELTHMSISHLRRTMQTMVEDGRLHETLGPPTRGAKGGKRPIVYRNGPGPTINRPVGIRRGRKVSPALPTPKVKASAPLDYDMLSERGQILADARALFDSPLVRAVAPRWEATDEEIELVLLRAGLRALTP